MKGRVRWSHVTIALALIAALAIASPAIGGPSLKKLVKKEVSRQIAKATGPQGPPGASGINGTNGTSGADGTARAYARVKAHSIVPCTAGACPFTHSKGITSVTRQGTGLYCVTAPGISPSNVPAAVTVDREFTQVPAGNASAMINIGSSDCPDPLTQYHVTTERLPTSGTIQAAAADDVGFTIVIP